MPGFTLYPLRSRFVFGAILALAAVAAGCGSAYVARTGPLTPCDASSEPPNPNLPWGICGWQLQRYEGLLFTLGYVREPDVPAPSVRQTLQRWSRTWSDTSDVLTLEFAITNEDKQLSHYVLRINVSGRTFVESAGKRRHVRDSASLTRDVDYLAVQLRGLLRQTVGRAAPGPSQGRP